MGPSVRKISAYNKICHEKIDRLFQEFKSLKFTDFDKAVEIFREFKSNMDRHMMWEEKHLFLAFESKYALEDLSPTSVLKLEHQHINNIIQAIKGKLDIGNTDTDIECTLLIKTLEFHDAKEENIIFPVIDHVLTIEEREELLARMHEIESDLIKPILEEK